MVKWITAIDEVNIVNHSLTCQVVLAVPLAFNDPLLKTVESISSLMLQSNRNT
jgi:hypothetical protein